VASGTRAAAPAKKEAAPKAVPTAPEAAAPEAAASKAAAGTIGQVILELVERF